MRRKEKPVIVREDLDGAFRQIEFLSSKGKGSQEACARCIEAWLDFSLYKRSPENIMKDINSLKITGNGGSEDRKKTLAARKELFEKTLGDNPKYEFCGGEVRKAGA